MSVGMKVAIGFLALTGVLIVSGMAMTLSDIMQRLDRADQAQVSSAQLHESQQAVRAVANTAPHAYPVQGRVGALSLPAGAVVQQIVPYQDGVYLLVSVPKSGQRILILDANADTIRQDIRLQNGVK